MSQEQVQTRSQETSLEWSRDEMIGGFIVKGKVNGQSVELHWSSQNGASAFHGSIDGAKIADEEAKEMWMKLNTDELEALLKSAKDAHTQFEQDSGVKDEDWAGWYAEFMSQKLNGHVSKDRLEDLLLKASTKYTGENWPREYSEFMAKSLWE